MAKLSRVYKIVLASCPRKNRRHILVGRGRMINSPEYRNLCLEIEVAWKKAQFPKISSGTWELRVHSTWPRWRHLDVAVPLGDADAPVSSILDALQACEALDDDARVMRIVATKGQGPMGTVFELIPLE